MEFHDIKIYDLENIAEKILKMVGNYRVLAFFGEMGVGKTTLILKMIQVLGAKDHGSSPTFSIVNEYSTENDQILYHFDLYRIESEDELYDIGYEEYFFSGSYCFVEWPEKMGSLYPNDAVEIKMFRQGDRRSIKVNLPT